MQTHQSVVHVNALCVHYDTTILRARTVLTFTHACAHPHQRNLYLSTQLIWEEWWKFALDWATTPLPIFSLPGNRIWILQWHAAASGLKPLAVAHPEKICKLDQLRDQLSSDLSAVCVCMFVCRFSVALDLVKKIRDRYETSDPGAYMYTVHMCVCVWMCVWMCVCVHVYVYVHVCVHV